MPWSESVGGGATLRTSTVALALAERPSGLTLRALTERLGDPFDMGDVLSVLRRRSDIFVEWDGRWLSRAASLLQEPRRLNWNAQTEPPPPEWRRFQNPRGAAGGWDTFRRRLHEAAFDPNTSHIGLIVETHRLPHLRLHIDHTILLERAAWIIWTVTDHMDAFEILDSAGFFMWDFRDPNAMVDVRHRIPRVDGPTDRLLATWCLRTPLELADSFTWLAVDRLDILDPAAVNLTVERTSVAPQEARAFVRARQVWERRQRGETLAHCSECGNALSDPNSVALGYGPECAARLGLGTVRALARGRDGVLFIGALPLTAVRRRMAQESAP